MRFRVGRRLRRAVLPADVKRLSLEVEQLTAGPEPRVQIDGLQLAMEISGRTSTT